jgi:hypothetical protein
MRLLGGKHFGYLGFYDGYFQLATTQTTGDSRAHHPPADYHHIKLFFHISSQSFKTKGRRENKAAIGFPE